MFRKNLAESLGYDISLRHALAHIAKRTGIAYEQLKSYTDNHILPSEPDLLAIENAYGITRFQIMLEMGIYSHELKRLLAQNSKSLVTQINTSPQSRTVCRRTPDFKTRFGKLYQADCLQWLPTVKDESVHMVFADPPFNLNKAYPSEIKDKISQSSYLDWMETWLDECIRILKPGGSLFIWNIPKWNQHAANYLNQQLLFRNWIAVKMNYGMPISGKLYPSHYSLLYFVKGHQPNTYNPDRLPVETCPKCSHELKDYGGYKNKLNPKGMNLSDVWTDIHPVRHSHRKVQRGANELPLKLLDRVIEMSTKPGDVVADPFGGSGTTYIVAELKKRKWLGCEIGPIQDITERFAMLRDERSALDRMRREVNVLFTRVDQKRREQKGLWLGETFQKPAKTASNF